MKKFLALFLSLLILGISTPLSFAVNTDDSASPWTYQKAEHLARRALIRVTPTVVDQLFAAGSAQAAVNLLFTPPSASSQTAFQQEEQSFLQNKSVTSADDMEAAYLFELYRDPFDAKRKLFTLFDDIFSVAKTDSKDITYSNIRNWHQKIYQNTLGNYKDLAYASIYDYSPTKYLDLLNVDKNSPNENFARELLQLFLMEEYLPLDINKAGNRNYSEADVAALAKILTGFTTTDNVSVSYNAANHNTTAQTFLGSSYANPSADPAKVVDYIFQKRGNNIAQFIVWRLYKFYISENVSQPNLDNFVAVFEQNNFDILPVVKAMLSSNQMYSDISMNEIRYKNPLELAVGTQAILQQAMPQTLDTLQSRAASTLGFSPYSPPSIFGRSGMDRNAEWMNSFIHNQWMQLAPKFVFRSGVWSVDNFIPAPVQLPTAAVLEVPQESIIQPASSIQELSVPVVPSETPSILPLETAPVPLQESSPVPSGDTVQLNSSPNSSNASPVTTPAESLTPSVTTPIDTTTPSSQDVSPAPLETPSQTSSQNILFRFFKKHFDSRISLLDLLIPESYADGTISPMDLIQNLEQKLYISRTLPNNVRDQLVTYLTTENNVVIPFDPQNNTYKNTKIKGLIALMLMQPEFLLQSGYDQNLSLTNNSSGAGKFGDKGSLVLVSLPGGADWLQVVTPFDATYRQFRGTLALSDTEVLDLDRGLKVNKVFSALYPRYQTGQLRFINDVGLPNHSRSHSDARTQMETGLLSMGAMAKGFLQDMSGTTNQISLFSGIPEIFTGAPAIAIGSASTQISNPSGLSSIQGTDFLNSFKSIATVRLFPGDVGLKVRDALKLDTIGKTAGTPGYQNDTQFNYIKNLINANIGKVYYVNANGGYDTHGSQKAGMNTNLQNLSNRMEAFFADMTSQGKKVTMVVFSEFGRTNRVNGSLGTDHGEGGGMVVLSNESALRIPKLSGKIDLASEPNNWLTPRIDVRAVWNTLMQDIFGIDISQTFPINPKTNKVFSMVDYTDEAAPYIVNIQENFISNDTVNIAFQIQDQENDFNPSGVSKVSAFFGPDEQSLTEVVIQNVGNGYQISVTLVPGQEYFYKIVANDENYNERSLVKSLKSPRPTGASGALPDGMNVPYKLIIPASIQSKPIPLAVGMTSLKDAGDTGLKVVLQPGTFVTGIESLSSAPSTWNGLFQQPEALSLGSGERYQNNLVAAKVHVGPSTTDVRLVVNKPFIVSTPVAGNMSFVDAYHSFDGQQWVILKSKILVSSGVAEFQAQDFGYFLVVDHPGEVPVYIPTGSSSVQSNPMSIGSTSLLEIMNTSQAMSMGSSTSSSSQQVLAAGSSPSSTGSSGGGSSISPIYILPTTSQSVSLLSQDLSLLSSKKILGDVSLKNQEFSLFIPAGTSFLDKNNMAYTGTFEKPQRLSSLQKPLVYMPNARELLVFRAGSLNEDIKASEEISLSIDISSQSIDWNTETVKLFYFDSASNTYKLVKDGGYISPDKKTLSINTKYLNVWAVFAVQK